MRSAKSPRGVHLYAQTEEHCLAREWKRPTFVTWHNLNGGCRRRLSGQEGLSTWKM